MNMKKLLTATAALVIGSNVAAQATSGSSLNEIGGADLSQISCDIFPLGCEISKESTFYNECKKIIKRKSNLRYGKYKQFCGFENLDLSYSYTSFLINQLQKYTNNRIPKEGMYLLKFCLLTAWHSPKEPIHRSWIYSLIDS